MKAIHATVTLKLVVPPGKTLNGLPLSRLSFFACTGIVSLESMNVRERPATREEIDRSADFLKEWEMHLAEWEALNATPGGLRATERAASMAREMRLEVETDVTGNAPKPAEFVFDVEHAGEFGAGIRPFTDRVRVAVLSGDPGGNPGEFAAHVHESLNQWFDGAAVVQVEGGAS